MLAMAAFSLSSCLNSNDDFKGLDTTEQQSYQKMMSGTYGKIVRFYYTQANSYNIQYVKYDSLENATWRVYADSTLTLNAFPVNKLDSAINVSDNDNSTEATTMRALRNAISQLNTTVNLKAYYYIPTKSWITNDYVQFFVMPYYIKQTINYEGANHTVYFIFDNQYGGTWTTTSMQFQFLMSLYGIAIDPKTENNLSGSYISEKYFRSIRMNCQNK